MNKKKLQIHIVNDNFSVGGGIEHIYQLVKGLDCFNFRIFGEPGILKEKFASLENVEVYDIGFSPKAVLENKPDLIHIHHIRPLLSFFGNPFSSFQLPIIYTAHGLHIHKYEYIKTLKNKILYNLRLNLERYLFKKNNKIIAVSTDDQDFIKNEYKINNIQYIPNGIFLDKMTDSINSNFNLREELKLDPETILFSCVARFNYQKGNDILLKAIASIYKQLKTKVNFLFIGSGETFIENKKLAETLKISNIITFMGTRTDVYNIINKSNYLILPSRWEGLPIVLLEAGLLKVPVIASNTYGNRNIIGKSRGFLFENQNINDLASLIKEALDGKLPDKEYSENLFNEINQNYSIQQMIDKVKDLYISLCE